MVKITCTQLAEGCSRLVINHPDADPSHSTGWIHGHSCAGTMRISIGPDLETRMNHERHDAFLEALVPGRLC